jgi:hypothetical protein
MMPASEPSNLDKLQAPAVLRELKQWLDLDGGKRLDLIVGHCKRTNNAPF